MHSDPIADMLTRIRNGSRARHERVLIPFAKFKLQLAEQLKKGGWIENYRELGSTGAATPPGWFGLAGVPAAGLPIDGLQAEGALAELVPAAMLPLRSTRA